MLGGMLSDGRPLLQWQFLESFRPEILRLLFDLLTCVRPNRQQERTTGSAAVPRHCTMRAPNTSGHLDEVREKDTCASLQMDCEKNHLRLEVLGERLSKAHQRIAAVVT